MIKNTHCISLYSACSNADQHFKTWGDSITFSNELVAMLTNISQHEMTPSRSAMEFPPTKTYWTKVYNPQMNE